METVRVLQGVEECHRSTRKTVPRMVCRVSASWGGWTLYRQGPRDIFESCESNHPKSFVIGADDVHTDWTMSFFLERLLDIISTCKGRSLQLFHYAGHGVLNANGRVTFFVYDLATPDLLITSKQLNGSWSTPYIWRSQSWIIQTSWEFWIVASRTTSLGQRRRRS